jgi:MoaA/NifB/PqqE/SkfB family radical SAM enzyme
MYRKATFLSRQTVPEPVDADEDQESRYSRVLNKELRFFFRDALRISLKSPRQAFFFLRTIGWQVRAARVRARWKRQGIHVPAVMIFSITHRCNLHCKGCYAQALHPSVNGDMSEDKLRSVFAEARELGISFAVLAGGEPLVRPEILDITQEYPEIISLLFTTGTLIDDAFLSKFRAQRHLVPVISMEGYQEDTDGRRGQGIYGYLQTIIPKLQERGIFYAVSLTATQSNFDTVTGTPFIENLLGLGCQFFVYLEYTPIREGTEGWVITEEQRARLPGTMDAYRRKYPALFIAVPGDESKFGGCLAGGRGFVHISADGDLEACPFAPYSDTNLRELSLREALQSELLKAIRENSDRLRQERGGCALWGKRETIDSLLAQ